MMPCVPSLDSLRDELATVAARLDRQHERAGRPPLHATAPTRAALRRLDAAWALPASDPGAVAVTLYRDALAALEVAVGDAIAEACA